MAKQTKSDLAKAFMTGRNCAQCTLGEFVERYDYDVEETDRFLATFGGGMEMGSTCGAVVGALMTLGLHYDDPEELKQKNFEFVKRFKEKNGSVMCKDLLGYDFSNSEDIEKLFASGKLIDDCPNFVLSAIEIVEDMIGE